MELFLVVYIIIIFAFIFSKGKLFQQDDPSEQAGPDVQGGPMNKDNIKDENSTQANSTSSGNNNNNTGSNNGNGNGSGSGSISNNDNDGEK